MGESKEQREEKGIRKERVEACLVKVLKIKQVRGYNNAQLRRAVGDIDFATMEKFLSPCTKNLIREDILAKLEQFVVNEADAKQKAREILRKDLGMNGDEFKAARKLVNRVKVAVADSMENLCGDGTQGANNTMFYIREVL